MVFSPYDCNGQNKIRFAFVGTFQSGQGTTTFKQSSCAARTRYEFDSQSTIDLSLTKGEHFRGNDDDWDMDGLVSV
jgi:hypothetical protein